MPREKEYDSPAARQAAYRARQRRAERQAPARAEDAAAPKDAHGYPLTDFWKAFPARPNDLAPSPEALKRLGETTGSLKAV